MSKTATTFGLVLPARTAKTAAYRWLYSALRSAILDGRLRPGSRLPATRELAAEYGLSRGTIVHAFEQLKAEGYLEGAVGSGTRVSQVLPEQLLETARGESKQPARTSKPARAVSDYGRRVQLFSNLEARPTRAFRPNVPALDLFPATLWAQVAARRLRRVSTQLLLGCDALGYLPLRRAVADYLSTSRGVQCVPEQVAILSGVQEALDLTARVLVNAGDRVCMENPGYTGARAMFEAMGAQVEGIGLDDEGLKMDTAALKGARLVYITPGHQFPLGLTMSLARRLQLLEWARKNRAVILEDDYDSEYRYSGRPVPALQGLDRHGLVLFTGSFSKVLFPSLRLGYLVLPPDLVEVFSAAISVTSRHAPVLEQAVLSDFIAEGHFGRHLRRMRTIYAERVAVLLECARARLGGLLAISDVEAGLQTAGWLRTGLEGAAVRVAAARRHVDVVPLSEYSHGEGVAEGLQLGFAAIDTREIRRGVEALGLALEEEWARVRRPRRTAR
ncbi:PLP-dependent aminotransferase family protein [Paludibaculum fermentans]|uniref:MocR-like pyridoxine biosynthesis transcription factor PdxR n=1 Tax=Paludibaculum fermentans TaxID=1473598 RepID=UPI003EBDC9B9